MALGTRALYDTPTRAVYDHLPSETPAESAVEIDADCLAGDLVGNLVYISGPLVAGVTQVSTALADNIAKMPAIGIITSKVGLTRARVMLTGLVALAGLTPGARYFVSSLGLPTATAPAAVGPYALVQSIGVAMDEHRLMLQPSTDFTKRIL